VEGVNYVCLANHTAGANFTVDYTGNQYWSEYLGVPIDFIWEFPWTSLDQRTLKKGLKYIQADTTGSAPFTLQVFVDNFFTDPETGDYTPIVSQEFVGGDGRGYGDGEQVYGGGRRLRDERPWGMPAEFKIMKLRIIGSATDALRFVTLSILYNIGTHKR